MFKYAFEKAATSIVSNTAIPMYREKSLAGLIVWQREETSAKSFDPLGTESSAGTQDEVSRWDIIWCQR